MTELGPYTYVTLSMAPAETPHLDISFHTNDLSIRASVINDRRPYLTFSSQEARVSISTTGLGSVTDEDLTTARQIFDAAVRYLADCERLHAEPSASAKAPTDPAA
ncbi:hypothetical protein [Nonomuraea dietziae]|uniref:hypothetical protein n=1 Tax=Nonomuraea dietziae TaxID=65515 RepID=UPI00341D02BA